MPRPRKRRQRRPPNPYGYPPHQMVQDTTGIMLGGSALILSAGMFSSIRGVFPP